MSPAGHRRVSPGVVSPPPQPRRAYFGLVAADHLHLLRAPAPDPRLVPGEGESRQLPARPLAQAFPSPSPAVPPGEPSHGPFPLRGAHPPPPISMPGVHHMPPPRHHCPPSTLPGCRPTARRRYSWCRGAWRRWGTSAARPRVPPRAAWPPAAGRARARPGPASPCRPPACRGPPPSPPPLRLRNGDAGQRPPRHPHLSRGWHPVAPRHP